MKSRRFTEEQIIGVLKEGVAGAKTKDLCRKCGISEQTFYNWKAKYGGMTISEANTTARGGSLDWLRGCQGREATHGDTGFRGYVRARGELLGGGS